MITKEARILARKIWDYNFLRQPLEKCDCILVLGGSDIRIADHAAKLFLEGWAPWIVFAGGLSPFTAKIFECSEAESFAARARQAGVPEKKILLETKSTNTGENLRFSQALFRERQLDFQSFVLVQKPNMLRRVYATALKQWPDKKIIVSSHEIGFESCPHRYVTEEVLIHEIVGDLQRIKIYPNLGHQVFQAIPDDVWRAYERLVEMGYTGNLVKI